MNDQEFKNFVFFNVANHSPVIVGFFDWAASTANSSPERVVKYTY